MTAKPPISEGSQKSIPVLMLARVLDAGGIERDVSKFARHLGQHGIQPHVACFNPGGMRWQEIQLAGIPLLTVPVKSFRSKSAVEGTRILTRYIARQGIRLVHAFDSPADIFGVPIAWTLGVPTLSSQLCYRELSSLPTRLIMAAIDRIATGVFVNCEAIATHLNVDWKLNRSRIHVCHNGYEPEEFHSRGRSRPAALADASIVIGTVALLRPEKNLGLLIQAFARVYRLDKQARLLIVGSGPMKAELLRLTADLQIAGACIFQEAVTEPAAWMRAIDVFVLPSLSEGFSNSLLEAMACGCCPVASRVGGTPELVRDGDCGILFESGGVAQLADSLIFLARNQVERERMASSATAYVRSNFTIQRASARLADIYWELLGESKENGYDTMRSETAGERQNKFSSASAGIDLAAQGHRC